MCGIAGFIGFSSNSQFRSDLHRMISVLSHRGPDDEGEYFDLKHGIALGHRRLAIIDLSGAGHQPMTSVCGRYTVVFNGEIYNYKALRREIEGQYRFTGRSDTEVLLACVSLWGLEKALERFNGMFAFALWDQKKNDLHLVRDRIGEKPLYYGWSKGVFLFGSELKALKTHSAFGNEINRDALTLFLRHNYIPAPHSIYERIYKLPPACLITIPAEEHNHLTFSPYVSDEASIKLKPRPYWFVKGLAKEKTKGYFLQSESEANQNLETILKDSIKLRMRADVPVGALLSGGIDSSLVVALMQAESAQKIRTFTIGFHEDGYDEAIFARKVARHLGTDHTELYLTAREAMEIIPRLPILYDEPFADSSQIPTFLVSQLARRKVVVALSGDGGDELFAGYDRYYQIDAIWKQIGWMPDWMRALIASILKLVPLSLWDAALELFKVIFSSYSKRVTGEKIYQLADTLRVGNLNEFYRQLISYWNDPANVVIRALESQTVFTDKMFRMPLSHPISQMMFIDLISYLPDDLLVKVDRASMSVGLEVRVPFLDHRLVEYAWALPFSFKYRQGKSKWVLRQLLYKYVPQELVERPKMGFGIPIGNWLRGPLRDWAESLLDEKRLYREGFFEPKLIRSRWKQHQSEEKDWSYSLYGVLMFQSWHDQKGIS